MSNENFKRSLGKANKCCSQLARVDHISPKRSATSLEMFFKSILSSFMNLAPILGRAKSSIPHGVWRFHFFPYFLKLEYGKTLISTVGIFVK
jgi:hypothetical protein